MPSVNDIAGFLQWLQDNISGVLQWLRKYRAGYLVGLLIAARIAWRVYKTLSLRRAKAKEERVLTEPGQAVFGAIQEIVHGRASSPGPAWGRIDDISPGPGKP